MQECKTKLIGIDIASGTFNDFNAAVKEANSIKQYISRLIEKNNKKGKSYCVFALIGVSENDPKNGKVNLLKSGKRGRPFKKFVSNKSNSLKVNPHIHIVLYANPADSISNQICEHLNKKFKAKVCWKKYCDDYASKSIAYVFKQSTVIRTVRKNEGNLLNEDCFQHLIDKANKLERIIFTFPKKVKSFIYSNYIRFFMHLNYLIQLICNNIKFDYYLIHIYVYLIYWFITNDS